jgi:hypothetical protein
MYLILYMGLDISQEVIKQLHEERIREAEIRWLVQKSRSVSDTSITRFARLRRFVERAIERLRLRQHSPVETV